MSTSPVVTRDRCQLSNQLTRLPILIAALAALSVSSLAQASPAPMHLPAKMSECEAGQCGIWEFSGKTGTARWPSGAYATLTLERLDSSGVTIRRVDQGGSTPGFVAVYRGVIKGDRIDGDVTWSW